MRDRSFFISFFLSFFLFILKKTLEFLKKKKGNRLMQKKNDEKEETVEVVVNAVISIVSFVIHWHSTVWLNPHLE